CGTKVRKIRTGMGADKHRAVLAGQYAAILCMATGPGIELCIAVSPVKITIYLRSLYPNRAQFITILHIFAGGGSVFYLLLTQSSLLRLTLLFRFLRRLTGRTLSFRLRSCFRRAGSFCGCAFTFGMLPGCMVCVYNQCNTHRSADKYSGCTACKAPTHFFTGNRLHLFPLTHAGQPDTQPGRSRKDHRRAGPARPSTESP